MVMIDNGLSWSSWRSSIMMVSDDECWLTPQHRLYTASRPRSWVQNEGIDPDVILQLRLINQQLLSGGVCPGQRGWDALEALVGISRCNKPHFESANSLPKVSRKKQKSEANLHQLGGRTMGCPTLRPRLPIVVPDQCCRNEVILSLVGLRGESSSLAPRRFVCHSQPSK